jgi:hypothetical protein
LSGKRKKVERYLPSEEKGASIMWHRHLADDPKDIGWKPMPLSYLML